MVKPYIQLVYTPPLLLPPQLPCMRPPVHLLHQGLYTGISFNVTRVAYCDAVATTSLLRDASENVFRQDTKEYDIELKPMLSAFQLRPFALISI
ncbi:hypothetical protein Tco_0288585, partial [Tanacetum coccineum]